MKNKINVREATLNSYKLVESLSHNYRIRKLKNVDKDRTKNNFLSMSLEDTRKEIKHHLAEHKKLYKKEFGEKLRPERINTFKEIILTFPVEFSADLEAGKISFDDYKNCMKIFIEKYEEQTGLKIISYQIHRDEKSTHTHALSTQYKKDNGRTFKQKGYKSWLQDLGGYAYKSMGLKRGIKKSITKDTYKKSSKHYEEILTQGEILESLLIDNKLNLANIDSAIKQATKPFKTLLTYLKRSMDKEQKADYIIKQQERALNQFKKQFPSLQGIGTFQDMLQYIEANKNSFRANKLAPKIK